MMMEHYFVLLELPGGNELKFTDGNKSPENFWANAAKALRNGQAKLICRRQDTGISEELRAYVQTTGRFTTFVLADLEMEAADCTSCNNIFKKTLNWIAGAEHEMIIDSCDDFQLITVHNDPYDRVMEPVFTNRFAS